MHRIKNQIVLLLILSAYSPLWATESLHVRLNKNEVHVQATAHPDQFQGFITRTFGMPGYHLLVWEKGGAASNALFTTSVSDSMLYNALIQIGAKPSNKLTLDTWEQRNNLQNPAPDQHLTGTPITIDVQLPNKSPHPLTDIIANPDGQDFDFRFGGNLANQNQWHSGCGVCLYSCPGGKIGNATYTVRDYVQGKTQFRLRPNGPLKNGTPVTLIFRIKETPTPRSKK